MNCADGVDGTDAAARADSTPAWLIVVVSCVIRGTCKSGIGAAANKRRVGLASIRAHWVARDIRALSVAAPVLASIWEPFFGHGLDADADALDARLTHRLQKLLVLSARRRGKVVEGDGEDVVIGQRDKPETHAAELHDLFDDDV